MIKNTNEILSHSVKKVEGIIREFLINVEETEAQGNLDINNMETMLGIMIGQFQSIGLAMAGEIFNNLVLEETDEYCSCGKSW